MAQKHEYALIREEDPQTFANSVNAAMVDGWVPLGGVSICRAPGQPEKGKKPSVIYAQAMLRRGVNGIDIVT